MNSYEQVREMLENRFEAIEFKCIKTLKENSSDYNNTNDEIKQLLNLPWFSEFLNGNLSEPITSEKAKTILRYMELQNILNSELKTMYYINGMHDAFHLKNIFEQLND